jgi:hypothetical protein
MEMPVIQVVQPWRQQEVERPSCRQGNLFQGDFHRQYLTINIQKFILAY